MDIDQKIICLNPFMWFDVGPEGIVHVCCPGWLEMPIGDLKNSSVDEIWNGKNAREIRQSIIDGSFRYCNLDKCGYFQSRLGPVKKLGEVEVQKIREAIVNKTTHLPFGPLGINCSYDRSCNLSCPSCRETVIVQTDKEEQILEIQNKLRNQALKDICFLNITGSGDPFGSPYFRKWLQTMRRDEMPNLNIIQLHTNGQLWTPQLWDTLPEEIRPLINRTQISIDAACAGTYAINRRGGSFEKLLENLEFISRLRKAGPLQWVVISMVVQENNFREMPDFIRLGKRFGFDRVMFSLLQNWGTYSEKEYQNRCVHLPNHPGHQEFLMVLKDELFDDGIVNLGSLTKYRNQILKKDL
ncbi:MAG: Radical SAM superfamily protein [Euryarchaeota archaeon ADurb.BinA087]|nr:MAG: Radical SAM superfamily protein [Euryarchaeota archaeon ADurb.BinA087]